MPRSGTIKSAFFHFDLHFSVMRFLTFRMIFFPPGSDASPFDKVKNLRLNPRTAPVES